MPHKYMQMSYDVFNQATLLTDLLAEISSPTERCSLQRMQLLNQAVDKIKELVIEFLPRPGRFRVDEHFNGFSLTDTETDKNHWLSDGVNCILHPDFQGDETEMADMFLPPGGDLFCDLWAEQFNSEIETTLEAYFYDE